VGGREKLGGVSREKEKKGSEVTVKAEKEEGTCRPERGEGEVEESAILTSTI